MHPARTTVFYDGECPLCRREINHYRRLQGAGSLDWIDAARDDAALAEFGLQRETAMARFHVIDASGHWHTGAWGFIELWRHLPAYRWVATLLTSLHLVSALDWAYGRFARWRLQNRCSNNTCNH